MMTKEVSCRGHSILHNPQGSNKALFGHQLQEAEVPGASEEDMGISLERSTVYSMVRTRAIQQECAKSPSKSRRRLQKPKLGRISRNRSCTLLRAIHPTEQNMWVITLQHLLLRLVSHIFHLHPLYSLLIHGVSSQKAANTLSNRGVTPHWSHTMDITKTPPTKLTQHKRCNKERNIAKSGSTSFETSITCRGNM
jgi:hypothetical protein